MLHPGLQTGRNSRCGWQLAKAWCPIHFARIYDLEFVRAILSHPRIFPHIGDDYAGPREAFTPNSDFRIWWVEAKGDQGELLGMFMFLPRSQVLWESHVALLPSAWGAKALRAGREVIPWVFEHTTCRRLIGEVPRSNTLAIRYAEACGFVRYGVNRRAFMKRGVLEDLVLLGISKEV
jgi:RimJ/RimL family protein N-acetyltransferase